MARKGKESGLRKTNSNGCCRTVLMVGPSVISNKGQLAVPTGECLCSTSGTPSSETVTETYQIRFLILMGIGKSTIR